jgi:hypothetical protein
VLVRYNRAVALREGGHLEKSLAEFDVLVRLRPAHGPLYLNRGLIWQARGDLPRAAVEFRAALRYQPDSQEARDRLQEVEPHEKQQPPRPEVRRIAGKKKDGPRRLRRTKPDGTSSESGALDANVENPTASADEQVAMAALEAPEESSSETDPSIPETPVRAAPSPATLAPTSSDTSSANTANTLSGAADLSFRCPSCEDIITVRWDKLELGKVMTCPRCRRNFTSKNSGRLMEVVKDRYGLWKTPPRRIDRALLNRLIAGVLAAAVVIFAAAWLNGLWQNASSPEARLPHELEPRAKLFAWAWLKDDFATMRQLTDPVQGPNLLLWCMEHPSPPVKFSATLDREAALSLEIEQSAPQLSRVQVRFEGLLAQNNVPPILPLMTWREERGNWIFHPKPRSPM